MSDEYAGEAEYEVEGDEVHDAVPASTALVRADIPRTAVEHVRNRIDRLQARTQGVDSKIANLIDQDPEIVKRAMENRNMALATAEANAIRTTRPQDWILRKLKNGEVRAGIASTAAQRMFQSLGISLEPYGDPIITTEDDGSTSCMVAGAVHCSLTNRVIMYVEAARNSKEDFTGRKGPRDTRQGRTPTAPNDAVGRIDLRSSTWALLCRKALEAITGIKNLTVADLEKHGINPDNCTRGYGFSKEERGSVSSGTGGGGGGGTVKAGPGPATDKQKEAIWKMAGKAGVPKKELTREGEKISALDMPEEAEAAGVPNPIVIRDLTKQQASTLFGKLKEVLDG